MQSFLFSIFQIRFYFFLAIFCSPFYFFSRGFLRICHCYNSLNARVPRALPVSVLCYVPDASPKHASFAYDFATVFWHAVFFFRFPESPGVCFTDVAAVWKTKTAYKSDSVDINGCRGAKWVSNISPGWWITPCSFLTPHPGEYLRLEWRTCCVQNTVKVCHCGTNAWWFLLPFREARWKDVTHASA